MKPHLIRSFCSQALKSCNLIKLNKRAALGKRYKCRKDCDDTSSKKDDKCTCSYDTGPTKHDDCTCSHDKDVDTKPNRVPDIKESPPGRKCTCCKKLCVPKEGEDPSEPPPFCLPPPPKPKICKPVCPESNCDDYDVYQQVCILRKDYSGDVERYFGRCYKNKQYVLYKKHSYYDAESLLQSLRNVPQPSSLKKRCI